MTTVWCVVAMLICYLLTVAASEIQMMTLPHTQYVIAEASTPVSGVNSSQVKTVSNNVPFCLQHRRQPSVSQMHRTKTCFYPFDCRHTMWSLRVRPDWRRSRALLRTRHKPTLNIWRSRQPVNQPPLSTSSQRPPTAAARVKFTSRNLEMYSKSSAGPLTHPSCKQQLVCINMHMVTHCWL